MNRLALACVMFLLVFVSGCSDKHAFPAGELPIGGEEETYYMKGVWVATAANIDYPSGQNLSAEALVDEAEKIVQTCADNGITAIFLQVRPYSDALYKSDIFPSSAVITGTQGKDPPIDVLGCFVEKAHEKGIELHAWINPFRITSVTHDMSGLAHDNPAVIHPEYVIKNYGKGSEPLGLWYDPGIPEVRKLICDGVMEIVENYDVDGIHLDDYFYPYDSVVFDDGVSYKKYSDGRSLADFRRDNITALISELREITKSVQFGVSPCGVWAHKSEETPDGTEGLGATIQAYSDVYADVKKWVEDGLLDYVCPQLYWSLENEAAPFGTLADWWCGLCETTGTRLYIGLAAYKNDLPAWAGEIKRQNIYLESKPVCSGVIYFSYGSIKNGI